MTIRATSLVLAALLVGGCATPYRDAPDYRPSALRRSAAPAAERAGEETTPPWESGRQLQLEDCIQIAVRNNRRVRIADRRILIAKDRLAEAWTSVLPKLTAEGRFQARNNDPGASFGGNNFANSERNTGFASLGLLVPIYDFGGASNQRDAELLRIEVSALTAEQTRQDLVLSISQAYFRVLEARKIKGVVDESIRVLERQIEIARDFLAQGLVARNDVLATEVQLAERRQDLIRAENNISLAAATLNRIMGVDVERQADLADVLDVEPWTGSYESVLQLAIDRRPDLSTLRRQIEIARAEYRSTRAGYAPKIFAFGDYNHSTDEFLLNRDWVSGGIGIQFPLFDGGATYARLQRSEKEIAEAVDFHDERADDIVLDVKLAYLSVREAAEKSPVARKSIDLAQENLRVVRDQYGEGLLTSADVLVEEDRLSRARSSYLRSLYEYHAAFARLTHAIGGAPPTR